MIIFQQAAEEKYKLCDETLAKLLQWVAEIEDKLAHQDVANEDVDELRNQLSSLKVIAIECHLGVNYEHESWSISGQNIFKKKQTVLQQVKEDIEAHARPISSCLDQIRQVVVTGSEVLASSELSSLEKNGRSLKSRFERASDRVDRLLRRLTAARDELAKFR